MDTPPAPDFSTARIDDAKIVDYLLNPSHRDGMHKERFFRALGFSRARPDELAAALRQLALRCETPRSEPSEWGVRWITEGPIRHASGRAAWIRAVWIVEPSSGVPRLITAYPSA
jgi:hypothetical protein